MVQGLKQLDIYSAGSTFKEPTTLHKRMPLNPILSQMNPLHTFTSTFPNIHFKIILPSTYKSLKGSFFLDFVKILYSFLISPIQTIREN